MDTSHAPLKGVDPAVVGAGGRRSPWSEGMEAVLAAQAGAGRWPAPPTSGCSRPGPGYEEFGDRKLLASSPHMYAAMLRGDH